MTPVCPLCGTEVEPDPDGFVFEHASGDRVQVVRCAGCRSWMPAVIGRWK